MNFFIRSIISTFTSVHVFALVGRSGSGKSFRAPNIASKFRIPLIIDDGLLIKGDKIVAGKSAKQEESFLAAVKCAVFSNPEHKDEVIHALNNDFFTKILIIGTSENMVCKIAEQLNLPKPKTIIHIEDLATSEEIATAMRIRFTEGKHVIPVSPIQITRSYPKIAYDSVKSQIRKKNGTTQITEKTLVKPKFSSNTQDTISLPVLKQMIGQLLFEYGNTIKVEDVSFEKSAKGYIINTVLRTPNHFNEQKKTSLSNYIADSLEKYGNFLVEELNVEIESWT